MTFDTLNIANTGKAERLHPSLLKTLQVKAFKTPREIQVRAIPLIAGGEDLMGSAETGSGKTLAYVLPAVHQLLLEDSEKPQSGRGPRVLVLVPTRELANQVNETIADFARSTHLRFGKITGGVSYEPQENLLRRPLDLLVATPGRLMDHMEKGRIDFSRLRLLVLDEADRMLDMGFVRDLEYIAKALPKHRQTVLFSATFEGKVADVASKFLRKTAVNLQLTHAKKQHALIAQHIYQADDYRHKRALLRHILQDTSVWQAIIFTATKRGADALSDELAAQGFSVDALHGDMKQSKRTRTLEQMHKGKLMILVATDVAARGLDVKKLSHVINFDMPREPESYVHSIGRTGRAGEAGVAISLVGPQEWPQLAMVERFVGQRLERQTIPGLEPKYTQPQRQAPKFHGGLGSHTKRSFHKKPSLSTKGCGKFKSKRPGIKSSSGPLGASQGLSKAAKHRSGAQRRHSKHRQDVG